MPFKSTWTEEEIQIIKDNHSTHTAKEMSLLVNHSYIGVKWKMVNLGLRREHGFQRESKLEVMLNGSLQSMYWIGFLLADGHFHKKGNTMRLAISHEDYNHLIAFGDYISCKNIHMSSKPTKYNDISVSVFIEVCNIDVIPKLCEQFQITSRKTYEPPNLREIFKTLTDDQIKALIIGFIDGDGYIKYDKKEMHKKRQGRILMALSVHKNWIDNMTTIKTFLYEKNNKLHKMAKPKINNQGKAYFGIGSPSIMIDLYNFIIKNNLVVLNRKWGKVLDYINSGIQIRLEQSR